MCLECAIIFITMRVHCRPLLSLLCQVRRQNTLWVVESTVAAGNKTQVTEVIHFMPRLYGTGLEYV